VNSRPHSKSTIFKKSGGRCTVSAVVSVPSDQSRESSAVSFGDAMKESLVEVLRAKVDGHLIKTGAAL
jgi:hypothetical protein